MGELPNSSLRMAEWKLHKMKIHDCEQMTLEWIRLHLVEGPGDRLNEN